MKNIDYLKSSFVAKIANKQDITLDTAKLWLDQAEKALKASQEAIHGLHERAYKIMTFAGLSAASIFTFAGFFKSPNVALTDGLLAVIISALLLYGILFSLCALVVRQTGVAQVGIEPKKLMLNAFINPDDDKLQCIRFLVSITENYQDAISANHIEISKKSTLTQRCFAFF